MAEGVGFEPTELLHSTVFKTAAFDHSAIPPMLSDSKRSIEINIILDKRGQYFYFCWLTRPVFYDFRKIKRKSIFSTKIKYRNPTVFKGDIHNETKIFNFKKRGENLRSWMISKIKPLKWTDCLMMKISMNRVLMIKITI